MEPRVSFTLVAFSVILTSPYVYAVDAIEVIRSTDSSDLFTNPDVNATKESASKTCGNYNSIDVGGQCDRDDCMICKCRFDKPTFLVYRRKCCNITDLITGLPSDASFKGKWITVYIFPWLYNCSFCRQGASFSLCVCSGPTVLISTKLNILPNTRPLNVSFCSDSLQRFWFKVQFSLEFEFTAVITMAFMRKFRFIRIQEQRANRGTKASNSWWLIPFFL